MRLHMNRSVSWAVVLLVMAVGSLRADSFVVTSSTPPDGALIQPFNSYVVTFNNDINPASVSNSDLTIDGQNATGFTIIDPQTVSFNLPANSTVGDRVAHVFNLSGIQDVFGNALTPFTSGVIYDNVPPTVISSSPTESAILPTGPLTETFFFSEEMESFLVSASSFELHGILNNTDYAPSSFGFDPFDTQLTINYSSLPADDYRATLFASGFADIVGLQLANNFVLDFCTTDSGVCAPVPTPEPGSLLLLGTGLLGIVGAARRKWLG